MDFKNYFEKAQGLGVLSTADSQGRVNAAVYARPHVLEDGSLAFIMRDRLTHHNLQSNPHAAFLFRESGPGYKGVRLHLTRTREESGTDQVKALCRRCKIDDKHDAVRFLVAFQIDAKLPLIGTGEESYVEDENEDGHVDTRKANFECDNKDEHLGCDPGIDVAG